MKTLCLKDFQADWNYIVTAYDRKEEQLLAAYRIIDRFFPHIADECHEFLKGKQNLINGGMHASIFAKVWGDAGGGDAGCIALAKYAYELGRKAGKEELMVYLQIALKGNLGEQK